LITYKVIIVQRVILSIQNMYYFCNDWNLKN
jgi:hypothetical protein